MVRPVEYSAIAGGTGRTSLSFSPRNAFIRLPSDFALLAATSARLSGFETRMGTFESDSAPPAITTSACREAMASAALTIAWFAEAHARDTVNASVLAGSPHARAASRARFGACTFVTTVPSTTWSTASALSSARLKSSARTERARSSEVSSARNPPAFANGVRHPATNAMRLPGSAFSVTLTNL